MTTLAAAAPTAICPACGLEGEGVVRVAGDIHRANYLCPAGHIWQTHWANIVEDNT